MYYSIRHLTKFLYKTPVSESIMETRMHPRSDIRAALPHLPSLGQPALPRLQLSRPPRQPRPPLRHPRPARPARHRRRIARRDGRPCRDPRVPRRPAPGMSSTASSTRATSGRCSSPASSPHFTPELEDLGNHLDVRRHDDPLSVLHKLNTQLYHYFDYKPKSTKADSPIDVALSTKAGVCQDFSHIMISLVRSQLADPLPLRQRLPLPRRRRTRTAPRAPPPTPGSRPFSPSSAGSASIPPTTWSPAIATSAPPSAATTPTSRPPTASTAAAPRASSPSPSASSPAKARPPLDRELPVPEDWSILVEKAQALPEQPPPCPATHSRRSSSNATDDKSRRARRHRPTDSAS